MHTQKISGAKERASRATLNKLITELIQPKKERGKNCNKNEE